MKRGAKRGERRGGRLAGVPNKATGEIKALAQQWGPDVIEKLAQLAGLKGAAGVAESEAARIQAMSIILDRGYGKAAQPHTGEGGEGPVQIQELMSAIDGKTRGLPQGR